MKKEYKVIGLMSGSSLDGLDIAFCEFEVETKPFQILRWQISAAETVPFTEKWQGRLLHLPQQNALIFSKTNTYFAHYMADLVNEFLRKHKIKPDFISSHGHTVFHYPDRRLTVQIGDGGALAAKTELPVVCDFRSQDVAIDGEGTPIAPVADKLLFPEYDFHLNIGGIANITCKENGHPIAYDVGPANQIFNSLANLHGKTYDEDGNIARAGKRIEELFQRINQNDYFSKPYPKALDNNWLKENFLKDYLAFEASVEDKLRTAVEQLAHQIAIAVKENISANSSQPKYKMLVTGGSAFNRFLVETIQDYCERVASFEVVVPDALIVAFKEAALMALMGVLRVENVPNTYASVTGAAWDTIGGAIYQGKSGKTII